MDHAGEQSPRCKHCERVADSCYEHCAESVDGKHEASPLSGAQADKTNFTIDYTCRHCGQSGSVQIDPDDIQWD